jgi:hypothetical protein
MSAFPRCDHFLTSSSPLSSSSATLLPPIIGHLSCRRAARLICAVEYKQERRVCVCVFFSVPSRPQQQRLAPRLLAGRNGGDRLVLRRSVWSSQPHHALGLNSRESWSAGYYYSPNQTFLVVDVSSGGKRCDVDACHTVCKQGALYPYRALPRPRGSRVRLASVGSLVFATAGV